MNSAHLTYALLNQEKVGIAPNMEISSMNITTMPTLRALLNQEKVGIASNMEISSMNITAMPTLRALLNQEKVGIAQIWKSLL
ncbi:hypothetical protein [Chlorogloeopsis fritschii]|uniref:hypothetical protein n=1 Tax=Chlorogloeopsis fritschii TaxID=1124 RepID=UPI0023F4E8E3|nr:hypothetical protein [Chlorogloeopsis fritschii]